MCRISILGFKSCLDGPAWIFCGSVKILEHLMNWCYKLACKSTVFINISVDFEVILQLWDRTPMLTSFNGSFFFPGCALCHDVYSMYAKILKFKGICIYVSVDINSPIVHASLEFLATSTFLYIVLTVYRRYRVCRNVPSSIWNVLFETFILHSTNGIIFFSTCWDSFSRHILLCPAFQLTISFHHRRHPHWEVCT